MQDLQLLEQALQRTLRLLDDLRRQQLDLLSFAAPGQIGVAEAGHQALQHAVDAAARMVDSIEMALRSAGKPG